jgi:hypothetical protein
VRGVPVHGLWHLHGSRRTRRDADALIGRGEKLPPHNGESPRLNPGRLRRVTLAAHPLDCSRPPSLFTTEAVRRGAPKVRP